MAASQAANYAEKAMGHGDNATIQQDISNPAKDPRNFADPSGATMKALTWQGKNKVQIRKWL
jgi:hypothetical protein